MQSWVKDIIYHKLTEQIHVPCDALQHIFTTRTVTDEASSTHPLASNISAAHANALYNAVLKYKPKVVIEVGMAFGISTLAILTALHELKAGGRLVSIDPGQTLHYHGVGRANVERAGYAAYHTLMESYNYLALPELLQGNTVADFAYIDGWHTFDYTLLDFFLIDKVLKVDGVLGFNDCALPSVRKVLGFVKTHRKYREINVGLKPNYLTSNPLETIRRTILRISKADRYFQKREHWEPRWDYWKNF
jgi:predicted O-methyltransferase YrrM